MSGFLFYSPYNLSLFLSYSESKYLLMFSFLGINKFTYDSFYYFYFNFGFFYVFSTFYRTFYISYSYSFLISLLSHSLWSIYFGFFSKYRIKGLGHRIYIKKNSFVFKIGYSHLLYKLLDYNLINSPKRFKKEYYFAIRGLDFVNLKRNIFLIQSFRIPNCYCYNGIFIQGLYIYPKEGKRGFLL